MHALPKPKALAACIVVLAVVTSVIGVLRSLNGSNDFDTYYFTGKAVLEKSGIYYDGEYYKSSFKGGPFLYAPAAACFFALLAWLPLPAAAVAWNLLNLFLFGVCLVWSWKLVHGPAPVSWNKLPDAPPAVLAVSAFFLLFLLLDNLTMAQINPAVFFLVLAAVAAWKKGREFAGGLALSAAILIKLTPVLFCVYFAVKRSWKTLAGAAAGIICLTILLPTLVFGAESNRLYHRQWLGRMIKPLLVQYFPGWQNADPHPGKMTRSEMESHRVANLLTPKNQTLEAAATRLFLKDRNSYAYSTKYPIYAAQDYSRMPVLFPLSKNKLNAAIRSVEAVFFFILFFFIIRNHIADPALSFAAEISLVFLSMTLFSPLARSHQFIVWTFPILTSLRFFETGISGQKILRAALMLAAVLYVCQALPYGKAAGMGAWANLVLWAGFASVLAVPLVRRPASKRP